MNKMNFVFWNKIYTISENTGIILICKENGDLILQTTPQKLSEEASEFFMLANAIYTNLILQG
jgi:hypothetical protein